MYCGVFENAFLGLYEYQQFLKFSFNFQKFYLNLLRKFYKFDKYHLINILSNDEVLIWWILEDLITIL